MRKSKLSVKEIEQTELAEYERVQGRKLGFSMMDIRDRGWTTLKDGIVVAWPVPKDKRRPGVAYENIPEGKFVIRGKETLLLDADELLKFIRWV